MATKAFDFEAFKALKISDYKSSYCKIADLKKATGALFLIEYSLETASVKCIMIPFKKYSDATKAYKQLKKDKEHSLDKVALAAIQVDTEGKENKLKAELKAGNLKADKLLKKSKIFTTKLVKMNLEIVTGLSVEEENEEPLTTDVEESKVDDTVPTDTPTKEKETPTITQKEREVHHENLDKLTKFFNKLANS